MDFARSRAVIPTTKRMKVLNFSTFILFVVGITGLEPATSRPPDVCATNCAKSRSFLLGTDLSFVECGCKSTQFFRNIQILEELFSKNNVFY